MDLNELQQLTAWLEASDLQTLELSRPGERVRLTIGEHGASCASPLQATEETLALPDTAGNTTSGTIVLAETAGTFLATHPMRCTAFAQTGEIVRKNAVLGLLKVGHLYAPVTAPIDGVVKQIIAEDGAVLGYGSVVLELETIADDAVTTDS